MCPKCVSHHVASILYGMPAFSEDLQRELDEGTMTLGGCDIDIYHPMPNYRCNDCGYKFRYVA
ncbi:Zn-ribbon protein [Bifidobacterium choerinum]|uniref:Zn-ribbon protein n=1 Tax=Bifidobacterium choerinum TaxID=35760 RepID=A0A087AGV0_9BIFI|nr:Zn-ribbon protein [Bifidobacterium choerinum]